MEIFYYPVEWTEIVRSHKLKNKNIGFVPTMGALHEGHISLIKKSKLENKVTVVSIYVNQTQFNDQNDLKNYPANFDADIEILEQNKVDYLFLPNYETIYPDDYKFKITENDLSLDLCGATRKGHFNGVLTVVSKLFNIIKPTNAYFGEKDYQQFLLIRNMVKALFMDVNIISCPTFRDKDGLALSSRNILLTQENRIIASEFPKILMSHKTIEEKKSELIKSGFKIDYIEEKFDRLFGAVYLGNVRLIDNVKI
ncbi:MAG: pantoate--beta-alanine ligase [Ignavibacteriae bacterium]|nr:pantoate--beta-alanine ligase [Ignavibacteriota bacterium]